MDSNIIYHMTVSFHSLILLLCIVYYVSADILWVDDFNGWNNDRIITISIGSNLRTYHGIFTDNTVLTRPFQCHTSNPEFLVVTLSASWCSSPLIENEDTISVNTASNIRTKFTKSLEHYPYRKLSNVTTINGYRCTIGDPVREDLSFFVPTVGSDVVYLQFVISDSQYLLLNNIKLSCLTGSNITVSSPSSPSSPSPPSESVPPSSEIKENGAGSYAPMTTSGTVSEIGDDYGQQKPNGPYGPNGEGHFDPEHPDHSIFDVHIPHPILPDGSFEDPSNPSTGNQVPHTTHPQIERGHSLLRWTIGVMTIVLVVAIIVLIRMTKGELCCKRRIVKKYDMAVMAQRKYEPARNSVSVTVEKNGGYLASADEV